MRTIKDITKENDRAQKSFLKIHKEFEKNHKVITNDRYDEFLLAQKNDYEEKYDASADLETVTFVCKNLSR